MTRPNSSFLNPKWDVRTVNSHGKLPEKKCTLTSSDIYIAVVSSAHSVCPKGYYIAIVSTIAETTANHHLELAPGFERLGRIEEKFMVRSHLLTTPPFRESPD
jgi:RAB protein geranylgeranyltransferase component A